MNESLNAFGWLFLTVAWSLISLTTGYCFWKILKPKRSKQDKSTERHIVG